MAQLPFPLSSGAAFKATDMCLLRASLTYCLEMNSRSRLWPVVRINSADPEFIHVILHGKGTANIEGHAHVPLQEKMRGLCELWDR